MSVYRVTEIIGSSPTSWEDAAKEAIATAARSLRDLRIAEVVGQDLALDETGAVKVEGNQISFDVRPYEVKTLRVRL